MGNCLSSSNHEEVPASSETRSDAVSQEVELQLRARATLIDSLRVHGKAAEAQEVVKKALEYCTEKGHTIGRAAFLLRSTDETGQKSLSACLEAQNLLATCPEKSPAQIARAMCCLAIGTIRFDRGEFDAAAKQFQEGLLLVQQVKAGSEVLGHYLDSLPQISAACAGGLAQVQFVQGNLASAMANSKAALQVKSCSEHLRLSLLNVLGNCLVLGGRSDEALGIFQELSQGGHEFARKTLGQSENGASFFAPDAVVDEADRLTWTKASKIECQEHTLRGKLGIAMSCKKLNRIDEAKNAIEDGLSFVQPLYKDAPLSTRQIAACLTGELAYLLIAKQDYQGSLDLFSDMRKLADELQLSDQQLQAEEGLARCYLTTGQLDKAHHHMDAHAGLAKIKGNAMAQKTAEEMNRTYRYKTLCSRGLPGFRWHFAAMQAVVASQPEVIKALLAEKENGFLVSFWSLPDVTRPQGEVIQVAVDSSFPATPDGRIAVQTSQDGSLWAPVHEKALAKYMHYLGKDQNEPEDMNDLVLTYPAITAATKNLSLDQMLDIMFGSQLRPEVREAAKKAAKPDWDRLSQAPIRKK